MDNVARTRQTTEFHIYQPAETYTYNAAFNVLDTAEKYFRQSKQLSQRIYDNTEKIMEAIIVAQIRNGTYYIMNLKTLKSQYAIYQQ